MGDQDIIDSIQEDELKDATKKIMARTSLPADLALVVAKNPDSEKVIMKNFATQQKDKQTRTKEDEQFIESLQAQYKEAVDRRDARTMTMIKNRLANFGIYPA